MKELAETREEMMIFDITQKKERERESERETKDFFGSATEVRT